MIAAHVLALCAVTATLMPGMAEARDPVYIQIDTGRGHLNMKKLPAVPQELKGLANQSSDKSGNFLRVSLGVVSVKYLRLGFDTTHYTNVKQEYRSTNASFKSKTNMHSLGMSFILGTNEDVLNTFYMYGGVRAGFNMVQTKSEYTLDGVTKNTEETRWRPGWTPVVGASWQLTSSLAIDSNLQYNMIAGNIRSTELSVGLRFLF